MNYVLKLRTRGVSPAGALEFLMGQRVTSAVDCRVLRNLRIPRSPVLADTGIYPSGDAPVGHTAGTPNNIEAIEAELETLFAMLQTLRSNPPQASAPQEKWNDWRKRVAELEARIRYLLSLLPTAIARDRRWAL